MDDKQWVNSATAGYYSKLVSNPAKLEKLKKHCVAGLGPDSCDKAWFDRESGWAGDVDRTSIILHIANAMVKEGKLNPGRIEKMTEYMEANPNFPVIEPSLADQSQAIADHMQKAADSFQKVADNLKPQTAKEATTMIQTIETITFVNGQKISDLSVDEHASLIASTEKRINELEGLSTKSKAISAEIKTLKDNLQKFVTVVDALS